MGVSLRRRRLVGRGVMLVLLFEGLDCERRYIPHEKNWWGMLYDEMCCERSAGENVRRKRGNTEIDLDVPIPRII
jgi:hypothetical protein